MTPSRLDLRSHFSCAGVGVLLTCMGKPTALAPFGLQSLHLCGPLGRRGWSDELEACAERTAVPVEPASAAVVLVTRLVDHQPDPAAPSIADLCVLSFRLPRRDRMSASLADVHGAHVVADSGGQQHVNADPEVQSRWMCSPSCTSRRASASRTCARTSASKRASQARLRSSDAAV